MTTTSASSFADADAHSSAGQTYQKPILRKIHLAAEEVLSTNCKVGGVCDLPTHMPEPNGAGS